MRDWFPCDLARQDCEEKMLYVGVYTDHIVFPTGQFPASVVQMVFVFRLKVANYSDGGGPLTFSVTDPSGSTISKIDGRLPNELAGDRLNLHLTARNLSFPLPGRYQLYLGLGADFVWKDVLKVTGPGGSLSDVESESSSSDSESRVVSVEERARPDSSSTPP